MLISEMIETHKDSLNKGNHAQIEQYLMRALARTGPIAHEGMT
jgi:hypothetical protein